MDLWLAGLGLFPLEYFNSDIRRFYRNKQTWVHYGKGDKASSTSCSRNVSYDIISVNSYSTVYFEGVTSRVLHDMAVSDIFLDRKHPLHVPQLKQELWMWKRKTAIFSSLRYLV